MKEEKISLEQSLVIGSKDKLTTSVNSSVKPLVVRGIIKKDRMNVCKQQGRDFYYIDTGYFGNFPNESNPSGKKIYHRIVKNDLQHHELRDVPEDRWNSIAAQNPNLNFKGWKNYDKKILLVMPNPKACRYYNIDYDTWVAQTKADISKYIDLPIEVRIKGTRTFRNHEYSIYDAFDTGVYATVSLNSIACLESVLYGVPAFVSVPCAATPLASNNLADLANPFKPDTSTIIQHCRSLAYGQFTVKEFKDGTAFNIMDKYEK